MSTTWKKTPRDRARNAAKRFWDSLDNHARWQLGDDLVLGALDWRDWLDSKPLPGFWSEVDQLRMFWEEMSA